MDIGRAYRDLGMSLPRYVLSFAIPVVLLGLAFPLLLTTLFPTFATMAMMSIAMYIFPVFCVVIVLIYPIIRMGSRIREIDNNMNLFITRMGVLASTNLNRKALIREIAKREEYGALSEEMGRIHTMMDYWNYTLPEAARTVAGTTPSTMLADFLQRTAHSLDAGEDLRSFLEKEQHVVMTEFGAKYREAIKNLELLKDLLIAMVVASLFMMIFAYFLPIFMDINAGLMLILSVAAFIIMEFVLLVIVRTMLPKDDIWHSLPRRPHASLVVRKLALPVALGCLGLGWLTVNLDLPFTIIIGVTVAPLLVPGLLIKKAEANLERCDINYDAFVRSIGSTVETVGGTLDAALSKLVRHDFGPLTIHIRRLYRRLLTKIDKIKAWRFFAADTGSNLITKFNDMYVEGITLGGRPDVVGRFVSTNFVEMIILRKERAQAASAFNGILYGLGLSIVFTLALGVSVMGRLNTMFSDVILPESVPISLPLLTVAFDVKLAQICAIAILVTHSGASALFTRIVSGRHILTPLVHFVGIVWIGLGTFAAANYMMSLLFAA